MRSIILGSVKGLSPVILIIPSAFLFFATDKNLDRTFSSEPLYNEILFNFANVSNLLSFLFLDVHQIISLGILACDILSVNLNIKGFLYKFAKAFSFNLLKKGVSNFFFSKSFFPSN